MARPPRAGREDATPNLVEPEIGREMVGAEIGITIGASETMKITLRRPRP